MQVHTVHVCSIIIIVHHRCDCVSCSEGMHVVHCKCTVNWHSLHSSPCGSLQIGAHHSICVASEWRLLEVFPTTYRPIMNGPLVAMAEGGGLYAEK